MWKYRNSKFLKSGVVTQKKKKRGVRKRKKRTEEKTPEKRAPSSIEKPGMLRDAEKSNNKLLTDQEKTNKMQVH